MADDLSLLLQIKGENAQAKNVIADTRTAITGLRTHYGAELQNMSSISQKIFGELASHLNVFAGERLPLVGGAFLKVTENLKDLGEEAEKTGGSFAAMAGPIGIAAVGMAATAAAAIELTKALFEVSAQTAEWQEKLYDLSKQTGISVETLNALEIAAGKTGGSIESIVASLGIFQKHLEESEDPASKVGQKIRELGIDTTNTEDALRQTLRILANMPEGFEQTGLALQLFGRSGKEILAILKETGGNIDEVVAKLGPLAEVTTENAKQAHEYDDAVKDLGISWRGITAIIGREALPAFTDMAKTLNQNEEAVTLLARTFGNLTVLITGPLQGALYTVEGAIKSVELAWLGAYRAGLLYLGVSAEVAGRSQFGGSDLFSGVQGRIGSSSAIRGITGGAAGISPDTSGAGRAEKLSAAQKLLNQLQDEYNKLIVKAGDLTKYDATVQELLKKEYQGTSEAIKDQILAEARLIDNENEIIKQKKDRAEAEKKIKEFLDEQTLAISQARNTDDEYARQLATLEAELKKLGITLDENTKKQLEENIASQKTLEITRQRIVLTQTLIDRLERERAVTDEIRDRLIGIDHAAGDETRPRVFDPAEQKRRAQQQAHDQQIANLKEELSATHLLGNAYSELFSTIGQGAGQAIQNYVLMGNAAGESFRKILASSLATVAGQAAAQAIYELALGFAALTPWGAAIYGPAPLHFHAAALLGSIAGIAAAAGRGVAGGAFAAPAGAGGASGGGGGASSFGGSASASSSQTAQPINLGSQRGPAVIHLVVEHRPGPMFDSHIVGAVVKDANGGGATRQVIVKEINRQS